MIDAHSSSNINADIRDIISDRDNVPKQPRYLYGFANLHCRSRAIVRLLHYHTFAMLFLLPSPSSVRLCKLLYMSCRECRIAHELSRFFSPFELNIVVPLLATVFEAEHARRATVCREIFIKSVLMVRTGLRAYANFWVTPASRVMHAYHRSIFKRG